MSVSCQASCVLLSQQTASSSVIGTLFLKQEGDKLKITGQISNLSPGKHGISIGVAGDLSQGATTCGSTFNPFGAWVCAVVLVDVNQYVLAVDSFVRILVFFLLATTGI